MSTKAIREALMRLSKNEGAAALAEVEDIEKAAKVLDENWQSVDFTEDSPEQVGEAMNLLASIAKGAK